MLIRLSTNIIINPAQVAYCVVKKDEEKRWGIDFVLVNKSTWRLILSGPEEANKMMCLLEKPLMIADILQ